MGPVSLLESAQCSLGKTGVANPTFCKLELSLRSNISSMLRRVFREGYDYQAEEDCRSYQTDRGSIKWNVESPRKNNEHN